MANTITDRLQEMGMLKFAPKEKTEEEKQWEIQVKSKELYSKALRELTEEYPEKFGETINFIPVVEGETITLTGNFDIMKNEVYHKELEYNGEKKTYKVILIKN
ncbi:MAG: hypothetical protein AABX53_04600 [Nanoarchaeota archaeon]